MARIFFSENDRLWVTDGTAGGTQQVSDFSVVNPHFLPVDGRLFFTAGDYRSAFTHHSPGENDELWFSDGSAAGTQKLAASLHQVAIESTGIGSSAPLNGRLYFAASDNGTHGVELWQSDGTAAGTHLLKDINTHYADSSNPTELTPFNGMLLFSADDGSHLHTLWRSDGTAAGTQKLVTPSGISPYAQHLTPFNGALFFASGTGLWKTDGSAAGTQQVGAVPVSVRDIVVAKDHLVLNAAGDLWSSDGTDAGTQMIAPISRFANQSVSQLTAIGREVFFAARDGTNGLQLWSTDGTAAGTQEVTLVNTAGTSRGFNPENLTAVGSKLFFSCTDGTHGTQLWVSDGTAQGTQPLTTANVTPLEFTPVQNALFFVARSDAGFQVWTSDGTAAGTHQVTNFPAGANAGSEIPTKIRDLTAIGGKLYFEADDGTGVQAFVTDGVGLQKLTSVAGAVGDDGRIPSGFISLPDPPQQVVVQPGEALASFDTTADVFLDLSLADQPQSYTLSGNDTIIVGPAPTTIVASAGNELVRVPATGTGGLTFFGQSGNHTVTAAAGANFLTGGSGAELFSVTGGANWITTGSGTGHFEMSGGENTVVASQGSSEIFNAGNAPLLLGVFAGSHQVALNDGTPTVLALGGATTISASAPPAAPLIGIFGGDHQLNMGAGGDTVFGVGGNATVNGGGGTNMVDLVTGHLQVNAGAGITHVFVNGGDNTLQLQSDAGLVLVSGFDPAHLHLVIASHINGQVFSDPSQIPTRHLADGSLLLDLGSGANGPEQMLLVGIGSIPSSAITLA